MAIKHGGHGLVPGLQSRQMLGDSDVKISTQTLTPTLLQLWPSSG